MVGEYLFDGPQLAELKYRQLVLQLVESLHLHIDSFTCSLQKIVCFFLTTNDIKSCCAEQYSDLEDWKLREELQIFIGTQFEPVVRQC